MKKLIGYAGLLGAFAPALIALSATTASGDGYAHCPGEPIPPSGYGSYGVEYDGTGRCDAQSTGLDTWRLQVGLSREKVNAGPIPNDWVYQTGSYTTPSRWRAVGSSQYVWGTMSCNDIPDNTQYKTRFRYQLDWRDGHLTYGYQNSDERDLC